VTEGSSLNGKPYTVYKSDKLRKRKRRRLILAGLGAVVVIIAAVVGGYYIWFSTNVNTLTTSGTTGTTQPGVEPPESMDILVLGADKHPDNQGEESRSDTVMLVHVDKEQDFLSILSLPRDLYVDIPDHGMNKLNAAYSLGGWELTKATVEKVTGINIDKAVEVDFKAFGDLTDALGGVYVDVDRRYYNQSADSSYENIKISPGYQLLNGVNALDYVRFRHDNEADFGRMLRQQRFINALREQAMGWNLLSQFDDAIGALLDNIWTTLSPNQILSLAWWGVRLDSSHIKQVSLIGDITNREIAGGVKASVVVATDEAIQEAVDKILTPPQANGGQTTLSSSGAGSSTATSSADIDRSDFTTELDAIENSKLWKLYADAAGFQLMAPGWLPEGYAYVDRNPAEAGSYNIVDGNGKVKGAAVKMVYRLTRQGEKTDQYLGIMETTWLDAPAAAEGTKKEYNGTTYTIVGTTGRTDHVWWVNNGVLYWVSNTLSYYLNVKDLLKVAESMMVVPVGAAD
jgi:polyisoprenyl-teichoic acid--peptidoglycan teichoic acid transferase